MCTSSCCILLNPWPKHSFTNSRATVLRSVGPYLKRDTLRKRKMFFKNIRIIFVYIVIGFFKKSSAEFSLLNEMSEKLDILTMNSAEFVNRPRQFQGRSWIWKGYEFGNGFGNREELLITHIESHHTLKMDKNITHWQYLEHQDATYLIGSNASTLLMYGFNKQTSVVSLYASISMPIFLTIKTFRVINVIDNINTSFERNDIYLILSIEDNKVQKLKWYYLHDKKFIQFWIWGLQKPIKNIEYFKFNEQHKLLLLYEDELFFNEVFTLVEIYEININNDISIFRLCNQLYVPVTSNVQICPSRKDRTIISFLIKDHVILYEYKDEDIAQCIFQEVQTIRMNSLINTVCFESGYIHYLALSGSTIGLYKHHINQFVYDINMEKLFNEIGNVYFMQNVAIDTYRNEEILLVQLKNLTTIALGWQGSNFKLISLPNQKLNQFDLSTAIIIPYYGFLSGNTFVKVSIKLNELPRPEETEIEKMLETKSIFEDIMRKQELIINKTNLLIEQNYLYNSDTEEFLDIEEAETNDLTVNNINDFLVELGSKNSTFQELQMHYENVTKLISELEANIDEIESTTKNAISKNTTYLQQINITGALEVKGTLAVGDLVVDYLNRIPIDVLMKECLRKENTKITGIKSFPIIEFTEGNLKIKNINGIPLTDVQFDEIDRNYTSIDLSKVVKLDIQGNLNFSKVYGMDWDELMNNIVLKNERKVIHNNTTIIGQLTANVIRMDYLNDLKYAHDYIMKSGLEDAYMTSAKTFKSLTVSNLQKVKTINDTDPDEFLTLSADQTLEHEITFENLVIDESLQIDGDIFGLPKQDIDPDLTLLNSNVVQSNTMFTNLYVSGKIYVKSSVNDTSWVELDDLILQDEDNVVVIGTKTFLGNVAVDGNIEIKTGIINGHPVDDFVTLDTRQILPNLSKISGDFAFSKVSYKELKNLEGKLNANVYDAGLPIYNKPFIFMEPPIVDEFSFLYINENITEKEFLDKLEFALERVHFKHISVEKLIVEDLIAMTLNGVNLEHFKAQKISKINNQNISGNITIKYLEVNKLNADFINNRTPTELKDTVERLNTFYEAIFKGDRFVHSLDVTGAVVTSTINDEDLNDILDVDYVEQFSFGNNKSINNIIVEGLINGLNFTEKVLDTVLKTEDHIVIKGPKKIKTLISQSFHTDYINGHSVDDIISPYKKQILSGLVKIKGSVNVQNSFDSQGKINNISFEDISEIIQEVEDKVYKLSGDFFVHEDSFIRDLNVFGHVQNEDINEFMNNLILLDEKIVIINGRKILNNSVTFSSNIIVAENFNEIDLAYFYQNAVLIDRPISIKTKLTFENDILLEGDLIVRDNLEVGTIQGINVDDLMENAVYLNRPTSITDTVSFSDVVFKSDLTVEIWNEVPMDTLFTLNKDEVIRDTLMCVDAFVDHLEIRGLVNGENLIEIYETTLMLSTDQNITGKITFLNNVYINGNFDSRYINKVDMTKAVSLNTEDPLIGNFVFENPVTINSDVRVTGKLNGIDISVWQSIAATTTSKSKQIITGKWTVYGNINFIGNINGSGSLNRIYLQKIGNDVAKQNNEIQLYISNKMKYLKTYCRELQKIKNEAENIFYRFKYFEYLKVIEFNHKIISIRHFELKNVDYLMINFDTCDLDIFAYTSGNFHLVASFSNFGYIHQYITLNYEDNLFFVTVGRQKCGKNAGNLWSFEDNQLKHILDLGNVTDVEKLGSDAFVIIVNDTIQEWHIKKIVHNIFEPVNVTSVADKNVQFFLTENDILLASQVTIYSLHMNGPVFKEFQNPFNSSNILTFHVGIYKKEHILLYDEKISSNYIFIYDSNLNQPKILQTLKAIKPSSILFSNFNKFQESLLIFSENRRKVQVYEYRGIEGFKYHSEIKIKNDKLFNFKLRIQPNLVKKRCLGIIDNNKLSILEAKMHGERLDMDDELSCRIT